VFIFALTDATCGGRGGSPDSIYDATAKLRLGVDLLPFCGPFAVYVDINISP